MLQKHLNNPFVIGACIALLTMAFVIFMPMMFSGYEIRYCNHDPNMGPTCKDLNTWMGYMLGAIMEIGIFGMPIVLGGVLAIRHRRQRLPFKTWGASLVSGVLAWWLIMAVVEILWLEPWRQLSTPSGETYNAYSLDALYGKYFVIILFILVAISYGVSYGIGAWWSKNSTKSAAKLPVTQ